MAYDLASIVSSGYKTGSEIGQDITRGNALQVAMEQTPDTTDPDTGKVSKDMFQVDSLAAQLTARAGNSRASDYFTKQAQDFKGVALDNEIKQLKVQQAHHDEFDRQLGTMNSGSDLIKAAMESKDLSEPERLRLASLGKQADTPEKFKALKEQLELHSSEGRKAVEAKLKIAEFTEGSFRDKEAARHNRRSESIQAAGQSNSERHWKEEMQLKKDEAKRKQEKDDQATILNYDDKLVKAGKIKDEETRKKTIKALNQEKEEALHRMRNRDNSDDSGKPDELGRYKGKEGDSKGGKQAAVPKDSKEEPKQQVASGPLLDQVKSTLGKNYDSSKQYTVDEQGNIRIAKSDSKAEAKPDAAEEDKPPVRQIAGPGRPMEQQDLDRLWKREMAKYEQAKRTKKINKIVEQEQTGDWQFQGTIGDELIFNNTKTGQTKKRTIK
jgi:hypothetical protein